MKGLASLIVHGRIAYLLASNADPIGTHQGRRIVHLKGEASVAVYDDTKQELVIFDGAALVGLAMVEAPAASPATAR